MPMVTVQTKNQAKKKQCGNSAATVRTAVREEYASLHQHGSPIEGPLEPLEHAGIQ